MITSFNQNKISIAYTYAHPVLKKYRQNDEKIKKIGGLRLYLADYAFYQNLPYKVH